MATPKATAVHSRQPSMAAPTPAALATTTAPTPDPQHALPPADTFDFLPPLYSLLRRLQQPTGIDQAGGGVDGNAAPAIDGAQPLERVTSGSGKLELQDLGAAASAIKLKIQRARQAVRDLPDVERTIDEQEHEIRELEQRIARQKKMLGMLGVNEEAVAEQDGRRAAEASLEKSKFLGDITGGNGLNSPAPATPGGRKRTGKDGKKSPKKSSTKSPKKSSKKCPKKSPKKRSAETPTNNTA